jgi:hypothetical protein
MQTKVVTYYDDETMEVVAQKFFINDEEVSVDDFADVSGDAVEIIDDEEDFDEDEEDVNEDCVECFDEMIDDYVEMIQDTNGCPECIKNILLNLIEEASFCDDCDEE